MLQWRNRLQALSKYLFRPLRCRLVHLGLDMSVRAFLDVSGGAAAGWALQAGAQQAAMPVVGYLSSRSPADSAHIIAAFRKGLSEAGFTESQNVKIESRFAESRLDRLPALADDLVRRQ